MATNPAKSPIRVVVVVFPDVKLLDVTGPMQVFADAKRSKAKDYELTIASAEGGLVQTDAHAPLDTVRMDEWGDKPIHTLLIAGGWGVDDATKNPDFINGVKRLADISERVGSVCTGAFILAEAGLLDECKAVTHWWACDDLAKRYPHLTVEPDRIYIKNDKVWTSAGVTAGIDMSLAMVAEDCGRKVALRLARNLVTFMARPGGQSQFSTILASQINDADGQFDELHSWITANLTEDLRVERLAERSGMSARNFARVYEKATGLTPAKSVELIRVAAARSQLEDTNETINVIAVRTGFKDKERLRRAMRRNLGLSPSQYRRNFGPLDR